MASSRPRAVQGISFSEAPFIEPASATTHPSPFVDGENGQVAPNTSSDGSPSSRNAQNAASGSNQEPRRQGVTQRSSFNPSASIWVPSASTQQARQRDDTRPLVVGYPPGYRIPDALQNRNQVQVQSQAQSQVQHQTPGQAQNQFDMLSFALAHTQAHDENPNVAQQSVQYQGGFESVAEENPDIQYPNFLQVQTPPHASTAGFYQEASSDHRTSLQRMADTGFEQHVRPSFIPHSQSLNSLQPGEVFSSPSSDVTPPQRRSGAPVRGYFSPGMSTVASEPRNYAPRTAGLPASINPIMMQPPPRFDLGLAVAEAPEHDSDREARIVRQIVRPFGVRLSETTELSEIPPDCSNHAPMMQAPPSNKLLQLINTATGLPTLADAMDPSNFPFIESARLAKPMNWGIIKLRNIPFSSTRAEVIAFLGRNSKVLNDTDEGVHIIMDKVTSKTMDAYVEFVSLEDAMRAVERHRANVVAGRFSRLGDRPIEVEVTSQANLMRDLFPIARGVFWNGVTPEIMPFNPTCPWDNFKGFISEEEMIMLVKHVEVPHRSPFSRDCPQRPYECLISTIKKFPWFLTDCVTIKEREAIYQATLALIRQLTRSILFQEDAAHLTPFLLRRLVQAAMLCPGFTPCMKDGIAWITNMQALDQEYYQLPRFADRWRHQYAIGPKPGFPLDIVEWYVAIIREQTHKDILALPLRERTGLQERAEQTDMYWGYFWAEVGYNMGPQFDDMTLAQAAHMEFSAVERILMRAFTQV
ncbi:hypothetical protein A0O28_0017500 [Trichoderma guizhouense]|uniref:RRM domain-containing protein n=1 Tax=Trichoderma guizhouense TaxID=1491466 RepID=A0A1T3CC38_9HYPO|nr:hypothetical protein A0O28_0017500 [Trichoderma guizhouense]